MASSHQNVLQVLQQPHVKILACGTLGGICIYYMHSFWRRKKTDHKVVILGGGFAGCQIAHDLQHELDVTLIETGAGFTYVPDSHKAICGTCSPVRNCATLSNLLPHTDVRLQVSVPTIDVERKVVGLVDGAIRYDYLVLATGSTYPKPIKWEVDGTCGAQQHQADQREACTKLQTAKSALVIGGGIVGTELASELLDAFADIEVTFVTGRAGLLPETPHSGRRRAKRFFEKRAPRAKLVEGQRCSKLPGTEGKYALEDGTIINTDVCYTCVGVKPNTTFLRGSQLESKLTKRGFLANSNMKVMESVYALGDVREKQPEEYLASYAHWEGDYVSDCIRRDILNRPPPKPYSPPARMSAVSLGWRDGFFAYDDWVVMWGRPIPLLKWAIKVGIMHFLLPSLALSLWFPRLNKRSKEAEDFQSSDDCSRPSGTHIQATRS